MPEPRWSTTQHDKHPDRRSRLMIRTLRHGNAQIVELAGELDIEGAPRARRALGRASAGRHQTVFLDLHGLTFMDSSGVHMIIDAHRKLDDEDRELVIACAPKHVRRLLELCGLSGILRMTAGGPPPVHPGHARQVRLTQATMAAAVRAMRSLDRQRLRSRR